MKDLSQRGFSGSLSGDSFSYLYVDLMTNIQRSNKIQARPHCAGFSTDIVKVNAWVATSHIHAKVRQTRLEKIQLNTSTNHKECTPGASRLHNNVELLKEKLTSCGTDPLGARKARDIATAKELPEKVFENLIKVDKTGDAMYLSFVNEPLIKGKADF